MIRKLPNGVNFRIENSQGEQKVVHHDRLIPVVENGLPNKPTRKRRKKKPNVQSESEISESDSDVSIHELNDEETDNEEEDIVPDIRPILPRDIRPRRQRQARYIPNAILWQSLHI